MIALAVALAMLAAQPADEAPGDAAVETIEAQLDHCIERHQTSADGRACYGIAIEAADMLLNQRWRALKGRMGSNPPDAWAAIVAEQRAWLTYRDATCGFYYAPGMGSLAASFVGPRCRLDAYLSRIADLGRYAAHASI